MLKWKGKYVATRIYILFLSCFILIIGLFTYRVASKSVSTSMADGEIILSADTYRFGSVYDRNEEVIVHGEKGRLAWSSKATKQAFNKILGINIKKSLNSRTTVCGNCPWLFGTEDNRFTIYGFFHPNNTRVGGSVKLSLDKQLQEYVDTFLNKQGYKNAYVLVSDYKTGELLAIHGNVFQDEMHPGSSLKPVLAAAAMSVNKKNEEYMYNCREQNHNFETKDGLFKINCAGNASHGMMNMEDALTYSCNGYFISLLQKNDRLKMEEELKKWGFDTTIRYSQFMYFDHSFVKKSDKESDYLLDAIGQANAYITPAGLNFCTNTLLNHGVLQEPIWFTEKKSSPEKKWSKFSYKPDSNKVCDSKVADKVTKMMQEVTKRGTGKEFYIPGFAAKTGTAEKSNNKYTVWTTGGFVSDEMPYSITVCLDDVSADTTSVNAGKIAQQILTYMKKGEK